MEKWFYFYNVAQKIFSSLKSASGLLIQNQEWSLLEIFHVITKVITKDSLCIRNL